LPSKKSASTGPPASACCRPMRWSSPASSTRWWRPAWPHRTLAQARAPPRWPG